MVVFLEFLDFMGQEARVVVFLEFWEVLGLGNWVSMRRVVIFLRDYNSSEFFECVDLVAALTLAFLLGQSTAM